MHRPRTVTDEDIFQAAVEAVEALGPNGLTLSAIATRAGISAPALVQRFGSKRELLLALTKEFAEATPDRISAVKVTATSPLESLVNVLVAESSGFGSSPEAAANHLAFLRIDVKDPEFGRYAKMHSEYLQREIQDLLIAAIREAELVSCDVERLARTVLVAYSGSLITWAIRKEGALSDSLRMDLEGVLSPYLNRRDPTD